MTASSTAAVRQLIESKNTAEELMKELSKEDKEKYKDQIEESKEIVKKIDSLVAKFIGKVDDRQGITRDPEVTVAQRIRTARSYVSSRPSGITKTENKLIDWAKNDLNDALKATNAFFNDRWPDYREKMEKTKLSPFKEVEIFTTNN